MSRFRCPHCLKEVQVEDNMAGQAMTCPHCSQLFAIPVANSLPTAQVNGLSAPPPQPENLGMATVSMILGIVSFIGVPFCGLVALITGIISTSKINRSNGLLLGKGMATTGIVFGCWSIIRIPILVIIAAMLLPALARARDKSAQIACISNLRQITLASIMYADSNDNYLPVSMENIQPYLENEILKCPCFDNPKVDEAYALLPLEERCLKKIKTPWETPIAICTKHERVDIVAYADGHVEARPKQNKSQP